MDSFTDAVGDAYEWVEDEVSEAAEDIVDVVEDSILEYMGAMGPAALALHFARLAVGTALLFELGKAGQPVALALTAQFFVTLSGYARVMVLALSRGACDLFAYPTTARETAVKAVRSGATLAVAASMAAFAPRRVALPAAAGLALGVEASKTMRGFFLFWKRRRRTRRLKRAAAARGTFASMKHSLMVSSE